MTETTNTESGLALDQFDDYDNITRAKIDTSSSGDTGLIDAVTGKSILVLGYHFVCTGANAVTFKETTSGTTLSGSPSYSANGGVMATPFRLGYFKTSQGEGLSLNLSQANYVGGWVVATYV